MKGKASFLAHESWSYPLKKKKKTSIPLSVWTVAEFAVCNACLEALGRFSELFITERDSSCEIK